MTKLSNDIEVAASVERVLAILTNLTELHEYDPTVATSVAEPGPQDGVGAARKVMMANGRNWFTEEVITLDTTNALAFQLTACNFPIRSLRHSYRFEVTGDRTGTPPL